MSERPTKPTRSELLASVTGGSFTGYWGLWTRQTKNTQFFTADQLAHYDEVVETASKVSDVYMCVSTQEVDVGPGKRGTIDSVDTLFACAADIDIGDNKDSEKNYPPNRETALAILDRFPHAYTYLQDSGRGFHVLWVLDAPMKCENRTERRRAHSLSKAFQKKLIAHFKANGFDIDNVGDIMRLVRVPYTLNHSVDPPAPVTPVFFDPTVKLAVSVLESLEGAPKKRGNSKDRNVSAPSHAKIRAGCPWYGNHTGESAASSSEPEWYAALGITACCDDAETHAHKYSARHPEYNEAETASKLERALSEAGPRTCTAIEQDLDGTSFCQRCPNRGLITSPVQLGFGYEPGNVGPIPIGYLADGSFVLRDQVRDIMLVKSSSQLLNFQTLLGVAPSEFWAKQFPNEKGGFNSIAVGESLIKACKLKGPFDPRGIRGVGVWIDNSIIVENLGGDIPIEAKHVYLCFKPLEMGNTRTDEIDVDRIHDLLGEFPWRHTQDASLLLGWLMVAPICGALNWRVHMFMFGPANSGKTTLHNFGSNLLAPLAINADGSSSAAGIRQSLGPDARPVLIDEFETDQDHKRLQAVTKLARSASSAESRVLMGTPEGKAIEFAIKAAFLFSAINLGGRSQADDSRIINLELTSHDSDRETGRRIAEAISVFQGMGPAWCKLSASHALNVVEALEVIKIAMPPMDSRHVQNMSTLLAGAYVALNQAVPTEQQAQAWVEAYMPTIQRHAQAHERDDARECWEYLIAQSVKGDFETLPLGTWIAIALDESDKGDVRKNTSSEAQKILSMHNMKIIPNGDQPGLMIANGSPPIEALFKDTKWSGRAWKPALGQIPSVFSPRDPIRIPGMSEKTRCVGIPLNLIPDRIDNPSKNENY